MLVKVSGILLLFLNLVYGQAGDECSTKAGKPGTCINIRSCQAAIDDIKRRINPQICGFDGADPIVCCATAAPAVTSRNPTVITTSTSRTPSTTMYVPPVYDYETGPQGQCEPLPATDTTPKTGRKAWDMCLKYQEELVFPCVKGVALTNEKARADRCGHSADQLIVGGVDTSRREFPHMVLLGFGDTPESAQWLCGGTLISEKYILTAGHCTSSRDYGQVSYVILGAHKRSDQIDSSRLYKLKRIIKHPDYKPPSKYNDIALLETEKQMALDQFAVPACLHIGDRVNDTKALATGWGATQYKGPNADTMQKVTLLKFATSDCSAKFPVSRVMATGFNEQTQLCYGDKTQSKDTCQGDSGGPLQIKTARIRCMYTIIGVTSFGRACGFIGDPGIYTRVAPFTPWIESIVWP